MEENNILFNPIFIGVFVLVLIIIVIVAIYSAAWDAKTRKRKRHEEQQMQSRQQLKSIISESIGEQITPQMQSPKYNQNPQAAISKEDVRAIVLEVLNEQEANSKQRNEEQYAQHDKSNIGKGAAAEMRVSKYLSTVIQRHNPSTHLFSQVKLNSETKPHYMDHLLLGSFGAIIIETKTMDGYIYGSRNDKEWIKVYTCDKEQKRIGSAFFSGNHINQLNTYVDLFTQKIKMLNFDIPINSFLVFADTKAFDEARDSFHCRLNSDCNDIVKFLSNIPQKNLGDAVAEIIKKNTVDTNTVEKIITSLDFAQNVSI